ncbi:geranylgeranyl hydrogenase, partial [Candidatus Bathyarchaeota archaeon]
AWVFPAGEGKFNVGLGVQAVEGHPNPKTLLYRKVLRWLAFRNSRVVEAGGWFIPTRRPLENSVWNGLILAGDAACQANPLHGGGIGQSLLGGFLAGKVASDAVEKGDVSTEALWPYNVRFMELMGARNAELDVFRMFLQNLTDDEIEYGMKKKLITEQELAMVSEGRSLSIGKLRKFSKALRAIGRPGFLRRLARVLEHMRAVRAHYETYPQAPSGFETWLRRAELLFEQARRL